MFSEISNKDVMPALNNESNNSQISVLPKDNHEIALHQ